MAGSMQRPAAKLMAVVVTLLMVTTVGYGAQIPTHFEIGVSENEDGGGLHRLHYRTPTTPFPGHRSHEDSERDEDPSSPPMRAPATLTPPQQEVRIECNSDEIAVAIRPAAGRKFDGMVYPKGLSKNSSCLAEFLEETPPVRYVLPLRSCNTMSTDLNDGGVEYFNTIVVQPHRKLVTNQGRGYHIRCRYQTKDKTILSHFNVSMLGTTPISATAPMPGCSMKIFSGDPYMKRVAENVRIGDPLSLVISIEDEEENEEGTTEETTAITGNGQGSDEEEELSLPAYGIWVTDCLVRDGLGWGEQRLIDSDGCPLDSEIMGHFEYNAAKTTAAVRFQAHKFPYTASVYYQCNVRLCVKSGGGCDDVPPKCGSNRQRREAQVGGGQGTTIQLGSKDDGSSPATIEVYSGLYVNEATDGGRGSLDPSASDSGVAKEKTPDDPDSICISQRSFAIGIAIAGLLLMLAVLAAVLIIVTRRRRRGRRKAGESTIGGSGSSIYSGPYTNTAYSHSS